MDILKHRGICALEDHVVLLSLWLLDIKVNTQLASRHALPRLLTVGSRGLGDVTAVGTEIHNPAIFADQLWGCKGTVVHVAPES